MCLSQLDSDCQRLEAKRVDTGCAMPGRSPLRFSRYDLVPDYASRIPKPNPSDGGPTARAAKQGHRAESHVRWIEHDPFASGAESRWQSAIELEADWIVVRRSGVFHSALDEKYRLQELHFRVSARQKTCILQQTVTAPLADAPDESASEIDAFHAVPTLVMRHPDHSCNASACVLVDMCQPMPQSVDAPRLSMQSAHDQKAEIGSMARSRRDEDRCRSAEEGCVCTLSCSSDQRMKTYARDMHTVAS
ncbi:unnamed protein product, partial [Mycena citricolor]